MASLLLLVGEPRPKVLGHETFILIRINLHDENIPGGANKLRESIIPSLDVLGRVNEIAAFGVTEPINRKVQLLFNLLARNASLRSNENV